ncbi:MULTISPECIES: NifU family protein [Thermomonosporaceae]|uniref:NifU family protein n=1 Tax=Thermomonosporaceae TaxID=2012 RepID=UPI00255B2BAF|nr:MULTISPECIES: NifU family protein [Thermomonosporaceae]MDL4774317.1 NifU family protein [Actinomadura xylanilytica]
MGTARTGARTGARDVRETGARIEELLSGLAGRERQTAEELVGSVVLLYGAGLARVMDLAAPDTVRELAEDDLVGALLMVHDLHPRGTDERVRAALDRVRPYLGSHSGGVELLGVDPGGVVRLRLEGNCHGCPSSQVTATQAIERAVLEDAPEITEVLVEGVQDEREQRLLQIHPYQGRECAVPEGTRHAGAGR